jgi:hypothetical protein
LATNSAVTHFTRTRRLPSPIYGGSRAIGGFRSIGDWSSLLQ